MNNALVYGLILILWWAASVMAQTTPFNDAVLALPSQSYGIANEACETYNAGNPNHLLRSTTDPWEADLENAANAGKQFFLNAGTYTISGGVTGQLNLANATAGAPTTIKPNNCAAVTIVGRTRPCNYHILAGLDLYNNDPASGGAAAALEFNRGVCAGTIVRNNLIRSEARATVNLDASGTHTGHQIVGNDIMKNAAGSNNIVQTGGTAQVLIQGNRIRGGASATSALDAIGPSTGGSWNGSYTVRGNWFQANPGEDMIDLKTASVSGSTYTLEENYWDCTLVTGTCLLFHGNNSTNVTYTVNFKRNYVWNPETATGKGKIIFHRPTGQTPSGITYHVEHNILHYAGTLPRVLEINRDNVSLIHNTIIGGTIEIGDSVYPDPLNLFIRNNIISGTSWDFEIPNSMDECSYNLMFNNGGEIPTCTNQLTGDPLFVNPASDWHLQPTSPARAAASDGRDLGAYGGLGGTMHNARVVENCNRVENPLSAGGKWLGAWDASSPGTFEAAGTECRKTAIAGSAKTYWSMPFGANHFISARLPDATDTASNNYRLHVRMQQPSATLNTVDAYTCVFNPFSDVASIRYRLNAVEQTPLTSNVPVSLNDGDGIACQVIQQTISLWVQPGGVGNWLQVTSVQHSALTGNGYVGLEAPAAGVSFDDLTFGRVERFALACSVNDTNPTNFSIVTDSCATFPVCFSTDTAIANAQATTVPLASDPLPLETFAGAAGFFAEYPVDVTTELSVQVGYQTEIEWSLAFGSGLANNDVVRCEPRASGGERLNGYRDPLPALTISVPAGGPGLTDRLAGGRHAGGQR